MTQRAKVRAVAFDIGGVLERVDSPDALTARWQQRLAFGMRAIVHRDTQTSIRAIDELLGR